MVGPVLAQELLLGSRRSRQLMFRRIYSGWLLLQLLFYYWLYIIDVNWIGHRFFEGELNPNALDGFAPPFLQKLVYQHFLLLLLATPAFTAGAITDEKASGTLQYLLAADLTAWEILIGKLLGRVFQVAILALAALPVVCFVGVFGGLSFALLFSLFAATIAPLFALGAVSLLASVWAKQTRDAVLGVYLCGAVIYFLLWCLEATYLVDPLYVLEPSWGSSVELRELAKRLLLSILCWTLPGSLCLAIAAWRLRPTYLRQLEGAGRPQQARWWRAGRAAVSDEPIRWKERHIEGLAPQAWLRRMPRWLGICVIVLVTVLSSASIILGELLNNRTGSQIFDSVIHFRFSELMPPSGSVDSAFLWQGIVALFVATLLVGIRCSGAVTGERERQTWEALLLTPLPAPHLVRGKLLGIAGASYPYLLAYFLPALVFSLASSIFAAFMTLLLMAVTWLAIRFVGSAGLWCSVRSKGSWRSLLGTAVIGYAGGFVLFGVAFPISGLIFLLILITLWIVDLGMGNQQGVLAPLFLRASGYWKIGTCLVLIGGFLFASRLFLNSAQKYVALRERIRQDREPPKRVDRRSPRRRKLPSPP